MGFPLSWHQANIGWYEYINVFFHVFFIFFYISNSQTQANDKQIPKHLGSYPICKPEGSSRFILQSTLMAGSDFNPVWSMWNPPMTFSMCLPRNTHRTKWHCPLVNVDISILNIVFSKGKLTTHYAYCPFHPFSIAKLVITRGYSSRNMEAQLGFMRSR